MEATHKGWGSSLRAAYNQKAVFLIIRQFDPGLREVMLLVDLCIKSLAEVSGRPPGSHLCLQAAAFPHSAPGPGLMAGAG